MSNRDEDRFYTDAATQAGADYSAVLLFYVTEISFFIAWRIEHAVKGGLGASDGGDIEPYAEVRGDAEPARVGDALTVEDYYIGTAF